VEAYIKIINVLKLLVYDGNTCGRVVKNVSPILLDELGND
jgi:hypothetical protein